MRDEKTKRQWRPHVFSFVVGIFKIGGKEVFFIFVLFRPNLKMLCFQPPHSYPQPCHCGCMRALKCECCIEGSEEISAKNSGQLMSRGWLRSTNSLCPLTAFKTHYSKCAKVWALRTLQTTQRGKQPKPPQ